MAEPVVDQAGRTIKGELDGEPAAWMDVGPVALKVEIDGYGVFQRCAEHRDTTIFGERGDDIVIVTEEIAEFGPNIAGCCDRAEERSGGKGGGRQCELRWS